MKPKLSFQKVHFLQKHLTRKVLQDVHMTGNDTLTKCDDVNIQWTKISGSKTCALTCKTYEDKSQSEHKSRLPSEKFQTRTLCLVLYLLISLSCVM